MSGTGERAEYRPMIEWYPERREDLFTRAAATYQDSSILYGGTLFWPVLSTLSFVAGTAITSVLVRRPVYAGKHSPGFPRLCFDL